MTIIRTSGLKTNPHNPKKIALGLLLLSLGSSAHAIGCETRLNKIILPSYTTMHPSVDQSGLTAVLSKQSASSAIITVSNKSNASASSKPHQGSKVATLIINKASLTVSELTPGTAKSERLDVYLPYLRDYVELCLAPSVNSVQKEEKLLIKEMMGRKILHKVPSASYQRYDFAPLIRDVKNNQAIGIIGDDYKRLIMNIEYIQQMAAGSQLYQLHGHSKVGRNRNDFAGSLTLADIYIAAQPSLGVDESYKGIVDKQGIAVFDYVLSEDRQQPHSGDFVGKLYVKWYTSKQDNELHFDDIDSHSDGYFNPLFNGQWRSYRSANPPKIAIWSLYNVSDTLTPDLNIGTGDFYPNPTYNNKGWANYR